MKRFKVLVLALSLSLFAFAAQAADPACEGVSQPSPVNLSSGTARLCVPERGEDGSLIDASKTVDCTVTFFDGSGSQIGTQAVSGAPGSLQALSVPRDGVGQTVAVCTVDGLSSDATAGTVDTIFPLNVAPAPPVVLPGS